LYDRINRFYDDRRSEQLENLKKKQEIIDSLKAEVENLETIESVQAWDEKTSLVLEAQKTWKTIGFGPKKENDQIWKEFRAICDTFFNAKKEFFKEANAAFDGVAEQKKELIAQAEKLSASTDWKETANKIIRLQKEWKNLGHAGRRNEQKLWKEFRSACDTFFEARSSHFAEKDREFEDNLKAKEALLTEIEAYTPTEDKKAAIADLKEFAKKFNALGMVPMKAKDAIYGRFKSAMDTHYGSLKMEGDEKEKIMFQAKLDTILSAPNADRQLYSLKADIRKEIDREIKEINLLENNLGFFANSKGADTLKKDVEKKIDRAKDKIEALKRKLKSIPNE
ncbi:DUF349 domain-containing protein, partial [Crocinitomicaceae bacterium]|nr:DUF349 domain-containing protein [Crocinitomicaceae bacterium]